MTTAGVQLGVSPLCWTNDVLEDLGGDIPLESCLQQAAAAGYQGIELGRKFPRTVSELEPLLSAVGLQLASGWHSGFLADRSVEEEIAAVRDHANLLRQLGAKVMVYGECGQLPGITPLDEPISRSPALSSIDLARYAARVNAFADVLLRDYGLKIAYHHHLMMLVEHDDELESFMQHTSHNVGLVLDSGHGYAGGVDIARVLQKYGSRIVHIHLKDVRPAILQRVYQQDLSFNDAVRAGLFTVPGEGCIDYAPIIEFVSHSGYQGWLIVEAEQDPQQAPPLATATRAAHWVSQQFHLPHSIKEIA
ncbi:myo-inosose-2 dehydratase [Erwiniaceae bacterium BAC15a-03b]|uniref:Myo-inosose-2 dehydratase n=1 Tax=Winslowiella arboricola TaxID=2978220 RepID=A0A9J6PRK6_9GAMM|nr:myo-inosose-2 dehydratase [Winslowiella arboricola]MCU5774766.1 myo-inosose-2 dehydratase [Winslowiella arboricola]MCU5780082.1 myo-inosose-2 dehydratase [Winslowiella arboricola]